MEISMFNNKDEYLEYQVKLLKEEREKLISNNNELEKSIEQMKETIDKQRKRIKDIHGEIIQMQLKQTNFKDGCWYIYKDVKIPEKYLYELIQINVIGSHKGTNVYCYKQIKITIENGDKQIIFNNDLRLHENEFCDKYSGLVMQMTESDAKDKILQFITLSENDLLELEESEHE